MEKFGQDYGFWLEKTDKIPHEKYVEICAGISNVCNRTSKEAKSFNLKYEVFGFPLKTTPPNLTYMSVCLFDGYPLFGVFDVQNKEIINVCKDSDFSRLTEQDFINFSNRNKAVLSQKARGITAPQSTKMIKAWSKFLYNNQEIVHQVIKADNNKSILLERPAQSHLNITM